MALALYRKYRPRTFAEVIGQEHVTEPLSQALRSGRLNHAYLFSGPRGCGKTSSARILARSLNCERGPTPEPCGECQSCRDLAPDGSGSIDVIEIDAASHGGVDDARDLRERAFFAPVSSRFKVYVIDEAHMVSSAGFNALLKLVEEPPEYVKFVFATTEPEKVLGTIKSRTHHYPFRLIPPGVLRPYLEQLTAAEGVKVEPAVFPLVVRAGAGSARDTLSVLDQLIAGAGADGVTYNRAVALLGVTDVALIDEMCEALAAEDGRGAYGVIDRVVEAGHDPRRFASDLLERLRDLIVLQQVPDAVTKGLLDAPHDQLDRMGAQASQLGQATLSRYADIVHNGLTEMRGTTAPRLLLELITARMLLPGADDSSAALLQRLERMERRLQAGGVPAAPVAAAAPVVSAAPVSAPAAATPPNVPPAAPAAPVVDEPPARGANDGGNRGLDYIRDSRSGTAASTPAAAPPPNTWSEASAAPASAPQPPAPPAQPAAPAGGGGSPDAEGIRRIWPDLLALVNDKSKKAGAIVREATVQDVDGTTLVLGFKYSTHADMLNASPDVLLKALQELLGGRWQVRCEVGGQPGGGGGGNRPAPPKPTPQPSGPPAPSSGPPGGAGAPPSPAGGSYGAPGGSHGAPQQAQPPQGTPQQVSPQHAAFAPAGAQPGPISSGARGGAAPGVSGAAGGGLATAAVADEDWPAPAVPGGSVPDARSSAAAKPAGGGDEDWPTPAAPGGSWPAPATPGAGPVTPDAVATASGSGIATVTPAPTAGSSSAQPVSGSSTYGGNFAGVSDSVTATASGGPGGLPAGPGLAAARTAASAAATTGPAATAPAAPTASAAPARPRSGGSSALEKAREAASRAAATAANGGRRTNAGPGSGGSNNGPVNAAAAAGRPGASGARGGGDSAWDGTTGDEPPFDPEYDSPVPDPRFPGLDPGDELLDDASEVRETSEEAALRLLMEALGAEKIGEISG
ncbi:DNA polymerase III subunit gamma and tau [Dactylosporangium sp. CA-233914]|uniref:DNA polymerase III subunit gamma and tau n=1 Tax=Dactylosporangium sp. CA-233914 TaxID=3239934 RepID=UPI003D93C195